MKETQIVFPKITRQTAHGKWTFWLWIGTFAAVLVWTSVASSGWDAAVYRRAMHAVSEGRNPYIPDNSAQALTTPAGSTTPVSDPPLGYIYPPATLLLLRGLSSLSAETTAFAYWALYASATLSFIWVAMQFVRASERKWFFLLAPVSFFFPGLLADGVLLGGNIAFVLYAAVLLTATLGWRVNRWFWFYVAVFIASCVKPPYLCLIFIAPLSARRQWSPAAITVTAGIAAFAAQAFLWPGMFSQYLQALDRLFQRRRDFGCSPAGLLTDVLYGFNIEYTSASILIYLTLALPLLIILVYLSRRYLDGLLAPDEWLPILLTGVVLLNPRIIEYDVAPVTLPIALVGWRAINPLCGRIGHRWIICLFLVVNVVAISSWSAHKVLDGILLVSCFAAGSWRLFKVLRQADRRHLVHPTIVDAEHLAPEM